MTLSEPNPTQQMTRSIDRPLPDRLQHQTGRTVWSDRSDSLVRLVRSIDTNFHCQPAVDGMFGVTLRFAPASATHPWPAPMQRAPSRKAGGAQASNDGAGGAQLGIAGKRHDGEAATSFALRHRVPSSPGLGLEEDPRLRLGGHGRSHGRAGGTHPRAALGGGPVSNATDDVEG